MKTKHQLFELPFLGFDFGTEHRLKYDTLIGELGEPIVGFRIENKVTQGSCDPVAYNESHLAFREIALILGEGFTLQKLDVFSTKAYKNAEGQEELLAQAYEKHFHGRTYKELETYLLITPRNSADSRGRSFSFSKADYRELKEKIARLFLVLKDQGLSPSFLLKQDFLELFSNILLMDRSRELKSDHILAEPTRLKLGDRYARCISLVDSEKLELPELLKPFYGEESGVESKNAPRDYFSFLPLLFTADTVVLNQVITIEKQSQALALLERRQRRLKGVLSSSAMNGIVLSAIENFLEEIQKEGELIVSAHYSLAFCCASKKALEETSAQIESRLFSQGLTPSRNSFNQMELFSSMLPGGHQRLKHYDFFQTSLSAALCFFLKEKPQISEQSDFFLKFTSRLGIPLQVDPSDKPMREGRISNRNKFVLGPSGSGKSFLMNSIVEQYLGYNYDVVIVDTGDSYRGTTSYKNGRYIQYQESSPITMNPFLIQETELNLEKVDFLSNLLFLLWKGPSTVPSSVEKTVIETALLLYFHLYFKGKQVWGRDKTKEELLEHYHKIAGAFPALEKENARQLESFENLYRLLELRDFASISTCRRKARALLSAFDGKEALLSTEGNVRSSELLEAYKILGNEKKKEKYDQLLKFITLKDFSQKPETRSKEQLLTLIAFSEHYFQVKELSFNGCYEFLEKFLPFYLQSQRHGNMTGSFDIASFFLVLGDFYRGGRYDKVLNNTMDKSLQEEPLIVFEIDQVKDNPKLFPLITLIIMDTFIQKMRHRKGRRKALIIEEAWKAIASPLMAGYILYLYKTVRKFYGEAIVVTQDLEDIISSDVIKEAIINNSDSLILLDQKGQKGSFSQAASLLSLNEVEQRKIFTINNAPRVEGRSLFKEFYFKRGERGEVYGNEVSLEQYLAYTTEKPEKEAVEIYLAHYGEYPLAISAFVRDLKEEGLSLSHMVSKVNILRAVLRT